MLSDRYIKNATLANSFYHGLFGLLFVVERIRRFVCKKHDVGHSEKQVSSVLINPRQRVGALDVGGDELIDKSIHKQSTQRHTRNKEERN